MKIKQEKTFFFLTFETTIKRKNYKCYEIEQNRVKFSIFKNKEKKNNKFQVYSMTRHRIYRNNASNININNNMIATTTMPLTALTKMLHLPLLSPIRNCLTNCPYLHCNVVFLYCCCSSLLQPVNVFMFVFIVVVVFVIVVITIFADIAYCNTNSSTIYSVLHAS